MSEREPNFRMIDGCTCAMGGTWDRNYVCTDYTDEGRLGYCDCGHEIQCHYAPSWAAEGDETDV